jgi:hypothetical protein
LVSVGLELCDVEHWFPLLMRLSLHIQPPKSRALCHFDNWHKATRAGSTPALHRSYIYNFVILICIFSI